MNILELFNFAQLAQWFSDNSPKPMVSQNDQQKVVPDNQTPKTTNPTAGNGSPLDSPFDFANVKSLQDGALKVGGTLLVYTFFAALFLLLLYTVVNGEAPTVNTFKRK